jgi:hypothetical protein
LHVHVVVNPPSLLSLFGIYNAKETEGEGRKE